MTSNSDALDLQKRKDLASVCRSSAKALIATRTLPEERRLKYEAIIFAAQALTLSRITMPDDAAFKDIPESTMRETLQHVREHSEDKTGRAIPTVRTDPGRPSVIEKGKGGSSNDLEKANTPIGKATLSHLSEKALGGPRSELTSTNQKNASLGPFMASNSRSSSSEYQDNAPNTPQQYPSKPSKPVAAEVIHCLLTPRTLSKFNKPMTSQVSSKPNSQASWRSEDSDSEVFQTFLHSLTPTK